jgi:hypothetical protein
LCGHNPVTLTGIPLPGLEIHFPSHYIEIYHLTFRVSGMYPRLFILLIIALIPFHLLSQTIKPEIKSFFSDQVADSIPLDKYVLKSELEKSQRLGISYDGVVNKYIIGYDLDAETKRKLRMGEVNYSLITTDLGNKYSKVTLSILSREDKSFYFYDQHLISPVRFYTRSWKNISSKYFSFYISDISLFNDYSVSLLDNYVESMLSLLQVDNTSKKLLQEKKIIYVLCKDSVEIKEITGFNSKGMYIMAFDEIVTTYNAHFHEISHLLVNFKLKEVPLYTLPFFQEGFAVATGGRGGLGRHILLDAGSYLQKTGYVPFNSILTYKDFQSEDASATYPVAGFYSWYLLTTYGINSYLELYEKYSGNFSEVSGLRINMISLPPAEEFIKYTDNYKRQGGVFVNIREDFKPVYDGSNIRIFESSDYYRISIARNITFKENTPPEDYQSIKFKELFPASEYDGEMYAVTAAKHEVNIYNLYTNNLIASYYAGFTEENLQVPFEDGFYTFYVDKKIFDHEINVFSINFYQ